MTMRVLVGISCALSMGCAGVHLHDASNSAVAEAAKTQYAAAKVAELGNEEAANLDYVLKKELEVVAKTHALRQENAYLDMAISNASMYDWWSGDHSSRRRRRVALYGDATGTTIIDILNGLVDRSQQERDLETARELLVILKGGTIGCSLPLPDLEVVLHTVPESNRNMFEKRWPKFQEACTAHEEALKRIAAVWAQMGRTQKGSTQQALQMAKVERRAIKGEAGSDKATLAAIKKELDAAKKAGKEPEGEEEIREMAGKANKGLALVIKADKVLDLGLTSEETILGRIELIQSVLTSVATGDAADEDRLQSLAAEVPALVGRTKWFRKTLSAPPVSNLVIELQYQMVLLAELRARLGLTNRRIWLLESKSDLENREVKAWNDLRNAMCGIAFKNKKHNGKKVDCAKFSVNATGQGDDQKVNCSTSLKSNADSLVSRDDCDLGKPWKDFLSGKEIATWEAVGAFAKVMDLRGRQEAIDYRLIDLLHRETLLMDRSAIAAWNALAETPIGQLAAYHGSGITQEEMAALITKLVSFGALAGGVAAQ